MHRTVAAIAYPIIGLITLLVSAIAYQTFGYATAILMFPFPIGALGYVVARFSPLQVRVMGRSN